MGWEVVYSNTDKTNGGLTAGYSGRQYIPASLLADKTGSQIRITFTRDAAGHNWTATKCYVGHKGTDNYDFDGSQAQVTAGSSASFTVDSDDFLTDEITFAFDGTKGLVVSWYWAGAVNLLYDNSGNTGATFYIKSGDTAADTDVSGYSTSLNNGCYCIKQIEVYTSVPSTGDLSSDLPKLTLSTRTGAAASLTLPKLAKQGFSVDLNLPALTADFQGTVLLNQATLAVSLPALTAVVHEERITFPALTATGTATARMPVNVGLHFPSFKISAKTTLGVNGAVTLPALDAGEMRTGQNVAVTIRRFTLNATGIAGILIHSSASTKLKPLQATAQAGARGEQNKTESFTVTATAIQGEVGSLNQNFPRWTISIEGLQGTIGKIAQALKTLSINSGGSRVSTATAALLTPTLRAYSASLLDQIGECDGKFPEATISATGFINESGTVDADLPAFLVAATGNRTDRFDHLTLSYQGR